MSVTREQIEAVMRGWGLTDEPDKDGDGIHSWRCEYPDRYGKCDCFDTAVDEMVALTGAW